MAKGKKDPVENAPEIPETKPPVSMNELTDQQKADVALFFRRAMEKRQVIKNLEEQLLKLRVEYSADCTKVYEIWESNPITHKGQKYCAWKNKSTCHIREMNLEDALELAD